MKKSMVWLGIVAVLGLCIGFLAYSIIYSYLDLSRVYIAKEEIAVHTPLDKSMFNMEMRPKKNIPPDAIQSDADLDKLEGRLTRALIVKNQTLQVAHVADAYNLREVVQSYSPDYVSVAVPIQSHDVPIELIHSNDVVSLIGTRREITIDGQELNIKEYVAEKVLVLEAVVDKSSTSGKIMVLVPREEAPLIKDYITSGRIYVAIDPRKFELRGK